MAVNTSDLALIYTGKSEVYEGRKCKICGCTLKIRKRGCHDCYLLARSNTRPLADLKKENTARRNKAIAGGFKTYESAYRCDKCITLMDDIPEEKMDVIRKKFKNKKDEEARLGWYRFSANNYCTDCNVIDYRAKQFYFQHPKNPEFNKNGEKVIWTEIPIPEPGGFHEVIMGALRPEAKAKERFQYIRDYFEKQTDEIRRPAKKAAKKTAKKTAIKKVYIANGGYRR